MSKTLNTLNERSFQNWRALAVGRSGAQRLLSLGGSYTQIRDVCKTAFADVLTTAERTDTVRIELQQWTGAADCGSWSTRSSIVAPTRIAPAEEQASETTTPVTETEPPIAEAG